MVATVPCLDCKTPISCTVPKGKLVVTPCFHTYCIGCLKEWVTPLEKACPMCRRSVCKIRSGKDFVVIWNIFTKIFERHPTKVWEILREKEEGTKECSSCLEDFPSLSLVFDHDLKGFKHNHCQDLEANEVTVSDIIRVVKKYASEDSTLAEKLQYQPPTFFEKVVNWISK